MARQRIGMPGIAAFLLVAFLAASHAQAVAPIDTIDVDLVPLITQAAADPTRFAIELPHLVSSDQVGTWTSIPGGLRWSYSVRVPSAVSLSLHAAPVVLPAGATLTIRGPTASFTYTAQDVHQGQLWSRVLRGDTLDLVLTVPASARTKPQFQVVAVQAGYRGMGAGARNHPQFEKLRALARAKAGASLNAGSAAAATNSDCIENYQCDVTAANTGPSHSTVGVVIGNLVQCTGTLVGNARNDGTPYVLTARHCEKGVAGGGQPGAAAAATIYWNATTPCGAALGDLYDPNIVTQTGATTVLEQQDLWVIRLDHDPVIPDAYFAGFDATGAVIVGGYSIHHALSTKRQLVEWYGQAVPVQWSAAKLNVGYRSDFLTVSSQRGFFRARREWRRAVRPARQTGRHGITGARVCRRTRSVPGQPAARADVVRCRRLVYILRRGLALDRRHHQLHRRHYARLDPRSGCHWHTRARWGQRPFAGFTRGGRADVTRPFKSPARLVGERRDGLHGRGR